MDEVVLGEFNRKACLHEKEQKQCAREAINEVVLEGGVLRLRMKNFYLWLLVTVTPTVKYHRPQGGVVGGNIYPLGEPLQNYQWP